MEEINLLDYMRILVRRKWTVIAMTLIVVLVAGITLAVMPKTYEGKTTLLFPEKSGDGFSSQLAQLAGFQIPGGSFGLTGRNVYVTILNSRTLSETVCERLNLDKYDLGYRDVQKNLMLDTPREGGLVVVFQAPTSWLQGHVPDDELGDRTAELAALIANTYISELQVYDQENALFMSRKNRLFIEDQIERANTELAGSEARIQDFREKHPTVLPPDRGSAFVEQAVRIVGEQTETDIALQEVRGQITRARATWSSGAPYGISPEAVIDSPVVSGLRSELARLEVRRATLLENFTDNHPEVVSLTQEIENTRAKIDSEVGQVVAGQAGSTTPAHQELLKQLVVQEITFDGLEARRSALADAMSKTEDRLSGLPARDVQYVRLLRDLRSAEMVYTTLLAEHAKAQVAEARDADNFIVLDEAIAPQNPAKPRVKLTLAAALMFGLMLGVMIATVQGPLALAKK